eukprot:1799275-Rhodomonas_salina.1
MVAPVCVGARAALSWAQRAPPLLGRFAPGVACDARKLTRAAVSQVVNNGGLHGLQVSYLPIHTTRVVVQDRR